MSLVSPLHCHLQSLAEPCFSSSLPPAVSGWALFLLFTATCSLWMSLGFSPPVASLSLWPKSFKMVRSSGPFPKRSPLLLGWSVHLIAHLSLLGLGSHCSHLVGGKWCQMLHLCQHRSHSKLATYHSTKLPRISYHPNARGQPVLNKRALLLMRNLCGLCHWVQRDDGVFLHSNGSYVLGWLTDPLQLHSSDTNGVCTLVLLTGG